ncbi:MAG: hypothetical protein LBJ41_00705 [Treponema sp.]|jgi:beta-galactosidase/beta-glucuronidase|nr:hypothetical protein [Treponema sp.]
MKRPRWQNLNGLWDFEFDFGKSGVDRKLYEHGEFSKRITVPFCPESKLSGIGYKDHIVAAWYRHVFMLNREELAGRVLLHFGAVDYNTVVYVNAKQAGTHSGGYSSFSVDITPFVGEGQNTLVVYAEDDTRSEAQPSGKQSGAFYSNGCLYTRTTGIWQTVWLEFVPNTYITRYELVPDPENRKALLSVYAKGCAYRHAVEACVSYQGELVCTERAVMSGNAAYLSLPIPHPVLWDVGKPHLYDLRITLDSGDAGSVDTVEGYFGMRSIALSDSAILINGRPVYQRLVLDQGFYPDGIYTAPTDDALKRDIELSLAAGFNGARLHQKVFEERFLYWADQLGYIVWGEHASWGLGIHNVEDFSHFAPEWREIVERDFNHPAIVGWCPLNETYADQCDELLRQVYLLTKSLDSTRPVIDASGYVHVLSDILDQHDYEQDPAVFARNYAGMSADKVFYHHSIHGAFGITENSNNDRLINVRAPYFISEYGGAWWNEEEAKKARELSGWGYGNRCMTIEEVYARIEGLTKVLLDNPRVCAFCYTQLTDVEQEQNGIYYYDRAPKFDMARIKAIFSAPSALETRRNV